jgi:quercetin dioxygenase-like cupin family protein
MTAVLTRPAGGRRSETPNAVMTTLASPTLSGAGEVSVWRVEMTAGQQGPVHAFDAEQVWLVVAGQPTIEVDGDRFVLQAGDALQIPAHDARQVRAGDGATFVVCSRAGSRVVSGTADGEPVTPPWVA